MTTETTTTRPSHLPPLGYSDDTGPRIRAYLASVLPLGRSGVDEDYKRGRVLIERMALSARGEDDPRIELSAEDCADVLAFVRDSVPFDESTWFDEREDSPSHLCGLQFVLASVIDNLRGADAS